jgi:hypothetical protein
LSLLSTCAFAHAQAGHAESSTSRSPQGDTMTEDDIRQFVDKFQRAWSSRRDEDFVAIWHPDGRLVYPFASRVIRGDELPLLNAITKQNAPELKWKLLDWTWRDHTVVVEWESSNVYGGHEVVWRGVDKLTLRDGRILEEVVYADTAPLQALRRGEKFPALIPFPDPAE